MLEESGKLTPLIVDAAGLTIRPRRLATKCKLAAEGKLGA